MLQHSFHEHYERNKSDELDAQEHNQSPFPRTIRQPLLLIMVRITFRRVIRHSQFSAVRNEVVQKYKPDRAGDSHFERVVPNPEVMQEIDENRVYFRPISTRDLSQMPSVDTLEKLTQSIAMLDAILSPQWEYRYFSFNAIWDAPANERMASMRNGSGDEYFFVFSTFGAILKGFDHEAPMSPWASDPVAVWPGVLDHVPATFASFLSEPAFSMSDCTFCIWRVHDDTHWQCGPIAFPQGDDPDGSEGLLWMFDGRPETYVDFAFEYFEKTVEPDLVRRIYAHEALTPFLVTELNPQAIWEDTLKDAGEIHFPVQS